MKSIWQTIRGYILWSYERGTIQYDVMVTLILLFVFLTPYWINYNDKPIERNPHPIGVVITPDKDGDYVYQIEGTAVTGSQESDVRDQLRRIIEPISGEISIIKYEAVRDRSGKVIVYKVWIQKG